MYNDNARKLEELFVGTKVGWKGHPQYKGEVIEIKKIGKYTGYVVKWESPETDEPVDEFHRDQLIIMQ